MSDRARHWLFLVSAPVLAALLLIALAKLPGFGRYPGPYGDLINSVAVDERHVTNAVTAVNFDYRGLDTLGEEYILFTAVVGVMLLLREQRAGRGRPVIAAEGREVRERGDAAQWFGLGFAGVLIVFGIYIVLHASLTPGGGFQGGAILGTASLFIFLAMGHRVFVGVTPKWLVEVAKCGGAGGYALIGVASMLAGGAFLQNVLPLGETRAVLSGGTIFLINAAVGLEVSAGFAMLALEFLEEISAGASEDSR